MIRRPPRSTQSRSSAASDVYKRQVLRLAATWLPACPQRQQAVICRLSVCVTPPQRVTSQTCPAGNTSPEIGRLKQPDRAHPAEILADSVRTEEAYTPSDLHKRADSHVEAELHHVAVGHRVVLALH